MFQPEEYEFLLHEIKNYICLINGSLQLITKQHPEVQKFRHWNEVLSDANHLSQMCRDVYSSNLHSKIQRKLVNPAQFFCSLENEVIGMLGANIRFSMDISQELPELEIDPVQIKHVLTNLIKNASEAISDIGDITLCTSVSAEEGQFYIQVQDNGCGIAPDQLDKIFLPSYTTKSTGTGIGLFITKSIIEAHDGSISCQSRRGEGTTFTLILPLRNTMSASS